MMSMVVPLMIVLKPAAMVMVDEAPGRPSSAPSPFCLPVNHHHCPPLLVGWFVHIIMMISTSVIVLPRLTTGSSLV